MADWNSSQYLKFKSERTLPSVDLISRIKLSASPCKILDIGCGPGNSSAELKKAFPNAYVLGIDSSENMIDEARSSCRGIDFCLFNAENDISELGRDFDLVFSNACIQWIPDHEVLLGNMLSCLKSGGMLAVQTPMNYDEPIHKIINETVGESRWKNRFAHSRIFYNLTQEEYFDILSSLSKDLSLWSTTYFHVMNSHNDIMEWYKATGLKPWLDQLQDVNEHAEFENEVLEKVKKAYPVQKNGQIIFRFPRFFFTAVKN